MAGLDFLIGRKNNRINYRGYLLTKLHNLYYNILMIDVLIH